MRYMVSRLRIGLAWLIGIAIAPSTATNAIAADAPTYDYGQRPRYSEGTKLAEAYVRDGLVDPASAQFEWPFDFAPMSEKLPLSKRVTGYATCGYYNAKNQLGGYVGRKEIRVIIHNGVVVEVQPVSDLRFVPDICKEMQGTFGMGPAPKPRLPLGVRIQPGPDGILFTSVAPQSIASLAGVRSGQIATTVNGVDLRGKNADEIAEIMDRAPDVLVLAMVGGATVTIDRTDRPAL